MPCSDSSSSLCFSVDGEGRLLSFEFAKITCGRQIGARTGFEEFCRGRRIEEILAMPYVETVRRLGLHDEERCFLLYLEWDALRSAIARYLGREVPDVDGERCVISAIEHQGDRIEVTLVVLPPKDMPRILPCGAASPNGG